VLLPRQQAKLVRGAKDKEHAMSQTSNTAIAVIGIDIGKNSFKMLDQVGADGAEQPARQRDDGLQRRDLLLSLRRPRRSPVQALP
jgi:hypothetical protein